VSNPDGTRALWNNTLQLTSAAQALSHSQLNVVFDAYGLDPIP
jgi:hypothetical protein